MTDLHMHSIYSDGSDDVLTILKKAQHKQLDLISITDHDSVGAYADIQNPDIRSNFSGKIITGTELSTAYNGVTVEMLGYGVDINKIKPFIDKNYLSRAKQQEKVLHMFYEKCIESGVKLDIDLDEFDPQTMYARPFIFAALKKYESNRKLFLCNENFDDYTLFLRQESYNPKSRLFIDLASSNPTPDKVIDAIHNAGGLAFFAHFYIYSDTVRRDIEKIARQYKLDGFECYYSKFTNEQTSEIESFCKRNNLYISGGSDYHGSRRPEVEMGTGTGNLNVNVAEINHWVNKIGFIV